MDHKTEKFINDVMDMIPDDLPCDVEIYVDEDDNEDFVCPICAEMVEGMIYESDDDDDDWDDDDDDEIPFDEPPLSYGIPGIKRVIFNDPATVIFWEDKTKTVVKAVKGYPFDEYCGFAAAIVKKMFGSGNAVKKMMDAKKG